MVVVAFFPDGIVIELSPEIDIFSGEMEISPEEELDDMPPEEDEELDEISPEEDDELEDKSPPEDEELDAIFPEDDDELELDEELLELEEPSEEGGGVTKLPDDELEEELLDEDVTQSANPRQLPVGFDGQHPFIQQRGPQCEYEQPSSPPCQ